MTGDDSSNKGCFGRKTNLFRESGEYEIFSGHMHPVHALYFVYFGT